MKKIIFLFLLLAFSLSVFSQSQNVHIDTKKDGLRLMVDGEPFIVNGMNWDYYPIGTNYNYSLWNQPDDFIKQALDYEMGLLQNLGINTIRVYAGIPKKWIEYIYNNYGIYTMLNHSFGRYGLTLGGVWVQNTEYSDSRVRDLLLSEVKQLAEDYKDTKGLLLFLLGNENNYGLFWEGAETEDIPIQDRKSTQRAVHMYKLFNEAAIEMKAIAPDYPISICNGDLLFLDIIAEECKDVDILGINVYRGISFTDLYDRVKKEYGKPVLLTEFGSDSFNAITNQEDQKSQAYYCLGNWKEIYSYAAGFGKTENSIGGFTFQFSDGWWKYKQTEDLDLHNNNASWGNGGYEFDFIEGEDNMNEEWFGICAKGSTNEKGFYELYPRAAYYALKEIHKFDPYAEGASLHSLNNHFSQIVLMDLVLNARGNKAALAVDKVSIIRISRLTTELTTYNTGGSLITTPSTPSANSTQYPDKLGFDHMESFYIGFEANPAPNFTANVDFSILGNVAQNPIDEIFYENRGRPITVSSNTGNVGLDAMNRIQVYSASYKWNHEWFNLDGFYRTGHFHWGYEGDFFGLYPEANYGPNIDIYNGTAPFGFELEGKRQLQGFKIAFGPQLWWGANPAFLAKYTREIAKIKITAIFHEDIEQRDATESSFAIPQPKTRRTTLHLDRKFGKLGIDLGGIWAGRPLNGREFQLVRMVDDEYVVYKDVIRPEDNWGGKIKLSFTGGKFNWYGQSAIMGLVAGGGADQTLTYTGWRLKDSGSGNQYNFISGFTIGMGKLQIAPNFLYQKPFEGPVMAPGRPRNILDDPFVVRSNREQIAGEILFTYDPTPATYMYEWDSDRSEDAGFALSAGLVFRHLPTTQDAAIGILPDGRTTFAFPGATPAADLWEVHARIVSKVTKDFGFIANVYTGDVQANGDDDRIVRRFGTDLRMIYKQAKLISFVRINDWGPYDYHRDYNLTYPLQLMADLSISLGKQDWINVKGTNIGFRATYRTLDKYSPRYSPTQMLDAAGNWVPNPDAIGFDNGNEWEIRTYIQISIK